jgi:hypothetical protein
MKFLFCNAHNRPSRPASEEGQEGSINDEHAGRMITVEICFSVS